MDEDKLASGLAKFYNALRNSLIKRYRNVKHKSILIWFHEIKSNDRLRVLQGAVYPSESIASDVMAALISRSYVREAGTIGTFQITAQGIWEHETKNNIIGFESLLKFIDERLFLISEVKALSDKEKTIIFSMIAARAFSKDSSVDLKKDEGALNTWEEILVESFQFLLKLGIVDKEAELFGKKGNEHRVSVIYRHTDQLPKKTKGVYGVTIERQQKYYLDISNNGSLDITKLHFLIKMILGEKRLNFAEIEKLSGFCNNIASGKSIYVFDVDKHMFHAPAFDTKIRDAFLMQ